MSSASSLARTQARGSHEAIIQPGGQLQPKTQSRRREDDEEEEEKEGKKKSPQLASSVPPSGPRARRCVYNSAAGRTKKQGESLRGGGPPRESRGMYM